MAVNRKKNITGVLLYIAAFLLFFIAACRYRNMPWFGTDELDIMVGGKGIASGYRLYNDFISQHMPVSYYISAFFELLGFKTVLSQRICFYAFYAFFWTVILIRFRSKVGTRVLVMYPLVFICLTLTYDFGHAVLSEHLAGIGMVILFLEFMNYYDRCELRVVDCVLISISVLLTFGTIFIAIFGIFIVAVGVFCREIQYSLKYRKTAGECVRHLGKNAGKVIFACAIPWIFLIIYYRAIDSLWMFFRSAYVMNREYYPKYLRENIGSIPGTILAGFEHLWKVIEECFLPEEFSIINVIYLIVIVLVVLYLVREWKTRGWLFAVISFLLIAFLSIRGVFSFHGTQAVAVIAVICSLELDEIYVSGKSSAVYEKITTPIVVLILLLISVPFFNEVSTYAIVTQTVAEDKVKIVQSTTDEDEGIAVLVLDNSIPMLADRPVIMSAATTPWTWECLRKKEMSKWKRNPPRVIAFDPDSYVWDSNLPVSSYAGKLVNYIEENYTKYRENIYFRNDYYDEAAKKADEALKASGMMTEETEAETETEAASEAETEAETGTGTSSKVVAVETGTESAKKELEPAA